MRPSGDTGAAQGAFGSLRPSQRPPHAPEVRARAQVPGASAGRPLLEAGPPIADVRCPAGLAALAAASSRLRRDVEAAFRRALDNGSAAVTRPAERLVAWAERTWAVESAAGLGYLLAQQLRAAGERVLDVQPKLGSPGTASGDRGDEQERSERRPVGRRRCSALDSPTGGGGRGPPCRASPVRSQCRGRPCIA